MRRLVWMALVGVIGCCCLPVVLFCQEAETVIAEQAASQAEELPSPVEEVWPRGEVREYLFRIAGQEVGRQWNQLVMVPPVDSGRSYRLKFKLNLDLKPVGQPTAMQMDGGLILTTEGRALSYDLDVTVDGEKQSLRTVFAESTVTATVTKGGGESTHRLPLSPDVFVVDNNMIGQWGLMLALLPLAEGEKINQKIFVPQALTEMDLVVDVRGVEALPVGGVQEEAYVCHIAPIGVICWMTTDGKLIKLEDKKQSLMVTLLTTEGEVPPESSADSFFLRTLPNRAVGYLVYLVVALAWLALLARGRMARGDLWVLLAMGGALFPLVLSLQVPLQRLYGRWVAMPGTQRGLSPLILGIGTVALSGIVQELFKFVPIFLRLKFATRAVDGRTAMTLGAAVGAGFGLLEAILITGNVLALGVISSWAIFERAFAILFHTAVASIMAWGIWKGSSLRYYLLAALLHSLGNYSVILFHQHLLSPQALELSVAAFDLCILAFAMLVGRWGGRDGAAREVTPKEVSHA